MIEIKHTSDPKTIEYALQIVEQDHPDLILHEWTGDIDDWSIQAHFNICFHESNYVGYYCFTWLEGDKLSVHFGVRNTWEARKCFRMGLSRVLEEARNYYKVNQLHAFIDDYNIQRLSMKLGFKHVSDNEYMLTL